MFERLHIHWANKFVECEANEKDSGYFIIHGAIAMQLLNELYKRFTKEGIEPIETLAEERKKRYWSIAKKYYQIKEEAVMGAKAAYVLDLITSNF